MLQKKITQTIQDLMLEHNYVVVPGFGGFVSMYQSAQIIQKQQIILPPSKKVSFNSELKNNDGLLVNAFSIQENITIKKAEEQIKLFVQKAFISLDEGKSIKLDKIGVLKFNQNLKIEFKSDTKENYNPNSYGMVGVPCQVLSDNEIVEKKNNRIFRRRNLIRAAVVLPFLIVGTILSVYLNQIGLFSNIMQQQASVVSLSVEEPTKQNIIENENPISEAIDEKTDKKNALAYTEPVVAVEEASSVHINEINEESSVIEEEIVPEIIIEKKEEILESIVSVNLDLKFQLIAGSFKSEANAKRFVKKIRKFDLQPEVVHQGNKYRVVASAYAKKSDAVKAKKALKKQKVSTWVNTLK